MSDERARLFVALDLPDGVRGALSDWAREHVTGVARLRLVGPESLHVTLCFLGSRPAADVEAIADVCRVALAGAGAGPLALALGDALWLPRRRPRVLTIELGDPEGRLAAVQSRLASALAARGFYEREGRPFVGHVTVARVQRESRPRRDALPPPRPLGFTADTVTLYRSRLGTGPARYEALE